MLLFFTLKEGIVIAMKKTILLRYFLYTTLLMGSIPLLGKKNEKPAVMVKSFPPAQTEESALSDDVSELLEECKDIEIEAPDIQEPSALEILGRTWGIYLAYKCYEFRYVIGFTLLCAACYKLKS